MMLCLLLCLSFSHAAAQAPSLQPITLDNADQLRLVERLGRGAANALDWRPNGKVLAIASSTVVCNSDGTLLAVASSSKLQIYSLKGEKPLVTLSDYRIGDLKWSRDNRFIASGSSDGTIYVWGVKSVGG